MVDNPLLKDPANQRMKRVVYCGVAVFFFCVTVLLFLSYGMLVKNASIITTLTTLDQEEVTLEEVIPFTWEQIFCFPSGTSSEEMKNVAGFSSDYFQEVEESDAMQYYFVSNRSVVAFVIGTADSLGFSLEFEGYTLTYGDEVPFQVDRTSSVVRLRA